MIAGRNQELSTEEIKTRETWESFLQGIEEKTFLQSWNWGEYQKMMGRKIWRLGVFENNELAAAALTIKIEAKRGKFLFVPHAPLARTQISNLKARTGRFAPCNCSAIKQNHNSKLKINILEVLLDKLQKISKQEKCSFVRLSPICERSEENAKIFRDQGFRQAPMHIHPELTWQLDLTAPEDELLINMRKTTRYLVKQGLNDKNLEILQSKDAKDVEVFAKIYKETAKRHCFAPFSDKELKNEFTAFSPDNEALISLAKFKGEPIAAAMFIFWQGIAFYHQGASSQKYSKIPASYLLQWEAIKEAKKRGCKTYNFWGISRQANHPWQGLTLFKMGFGGYAKAYVKTQDLALSWRYWPNYIFEKIRKLKRYG